MRDLLGVDVDLKDLLPPDAATNGFDNRRRGAARFLLPDGAIPGSGRQGPDAAIANGPRPWMIKKRFDIKDEKIASSRRAASIAIWTTAWRSSVRGSRPTSRSRCGISGHAFRGNYRFRISGYGFQTDKPVTFHVMAGTLTEVTEQHLVGYFEVPAEQADRRGVRRAPGGENTIRIIADGLGVTPPVVEKAGADKLQGAGTGRAVGGDRRTAARLLAAAQPSPHLRRPDAGTDVRTTATAWRSSRSSPLADAERLLRDFIRRAFGGR